MGELGEYSGDFGVGEGGQYSGESGAVIAFSSGMSSIPDREGDGDGLVV